MRAHGTKQWWSFVASSLTREIAWAERLNMKLNIGNKIISADIKLQYKEKNLFCWLKLIGIYHHSVG